MKLLTVKAVCTFLADNDAPFDPSTRKLDLVKQARHLAVLLESERQEEEKHNKTHQRERQTTTSLEKEVEEAAPIGINGKASVGR